MMVDILEGNQMVTPHIKVDPVVGVDAQPNNDLVESKTLLHSSVGKFDCDPNKYLYNLVTHPHKEVPASKTLTTNDEAVALPNQRLGNFEEPVIDHSNNVDKKKILTMLRPHKAVRQLTMRHHPHY